ncbi:hypothetical protein L1049_006133 [Liquidambar formosana]|uniref:FBD domain-containing protein n=1 Tax=Liquidambar formosana TaxID=63359 RepID=A0AAP0RGV4_LIQFO
MGLRPELELIKILLARSPALEKMFIERDVSIDKNAELYMTIELMRFRRASSKAEIIYLEPEE